MTTSLPLTFRTRQIWPFLAIWLIGCILVFQYMTLQRIGQYHDFVPLLTGNIVAYLRGWIYYIPFELVSIGIIIKVLHGYRQLFGLNSLVLTPHHLLHYEVAFLPAILLAIPFFCPITNALRYGLLYAAEWGWSGYFPGYFFTWRMFFNYLLPVLLFSYGYINVNLVLDYMDWFQSRATDTGQFEFQADLLPALPTVVKEVKKADVTWPDLPISGYTSDQPAPVEPDYTVRLSGLMPETSAILRNLVALDKVGETQIAVYQVYYFSVHGKHYAAHTAKGTYTIHKTISELAAGLDPHSFYRVNRSVIVNLNYVKNYSHWEYDKYMVRLTDDRTEFIMPRNRLKELKLRLSQLSS